MAVPEDTIIDLIEEMPLFDGKLAYSAFREYVKANLKYPSSGFDAWGRVFVEFVVEKDGSVSHAEVVRGLDPELDAETLRIVRSSSRRWTPGKLRGKLVRMRYTFLFRFNLHAGQPY